MSLVRVLLAAAVLVASAGQNLAAEGYFQEEFRIPLAPAGPRGLAALLVRPNQPGRHPLALIEHGSPRSSSARPNMSPSDLLPQAMEFARRGWTAVVVMRRGYGDSGGQWAEDFGECSDPDYVAAGYAGAADLTAAIAFLGRRPDVDPAHVISVGVSAGGFATIALAANAPPGLVAAINFAGGRGSIHADEVCSEDRLIEAFRVFGKQARIPTLWVYALNDHFFGPRLAQRLKEAFAAGGANVEFIRAPAFGSDGHRLFSQDGIPVWSEFVDAFLQHHGLTREALSQPGPALVAPRNLSPNGREGFAAYLMSPPHKAFAASPDGHHFGWRSGQQTTEAARSGALQHCGEHANDCDVLFVDDAAVSTK
jgi:dienelactone hydrolase